MIRICQLVCIPWIPFVIMLKPNNMIILLSIMSTKQWSSREIFKESDMRDLMSQMYMALTQAGENAKSLSTIDVEQIRKLIPVGNRQTKEATREFLRELEYYKDISDSVEAFERNVLAPSRFLPAELSPGGAFSGPVPSQAAKPGKPGEGKPSQDNARQAKPS